MYPYPNLVGAPPGVGVIAGTKKSLFSFCLLAKGERRFLNNSETRAGHDPVWWGSPTIWMTHFTNMLYPGHGGASVGGLPGTTPKKPKP